MDKKYKSNIKNWEGFANEDALWSILTDPNKKDGKWEETAFFETGEREVNFVLQHLRNLKVLPESLETALDFGCGVGRISRAFCPHFKNVIGVDASPTMIEKANALNKAYSDKLSFVLNEATSMDFVPDNSLTLCFSTIVLQHIPVTPAMEFIESFVRKTAPNGLVVFQLPTKDIRSISFIQKIKEKVRIRERLASIGLNTGPQMEMNVFDELAIQKAVERNGGKIIDTKYTNHTAPSFNGGVTFVDRKDCVDYESCLYVIRKE